METAIFSINDFGNLFTNFERMLQPSDFLFDMWQIFLLDLTFKQALFKLDMNVFLCKDMQGISPLT